MPHQHMRTGRSGDVRYLTVAMGLVVVFLIVEVVVAVQASSLALFADAGHMLADAGAVAAAIWAARLAGRPAAGAWTYGLSRAEVLSAAGNGITLLVVAGVVTVEAVRRLLHPPPVAGIALVVVAVIGAGVNLLATAVLARADRSSLNVQGAFQHVLTDLYAFVGTAVAGVVILATGFRRADPIASLVVVVLMLRSAWLLVRRSGRVLLEAAPESIDMAAVRAHLLETPHVTDVHDLHVWTVGSDLPALSAHVVVADCCFPEGHAPQVLDQLQQRLLGSFDVDHSTFQLEPVGHAEHEASLHG